MKRASFIIALFFAITAAGCQPMKPEQIEAAIKKDLSKVQCAQFQSLHYHYKWPVSSGVQAYLKVTDVECYKRAVRQIIQTLSEQGADPGVTAIYVDGVLPDGTVVGTTVFGVRPRATGGEILESEK